MGSSSNSPSPSARDLSSSPASPSRGSPHPSSHRHHASAHRHRVRSRLHGSADEHLPLLSDSGPSTPRRLLSPSHVGSPAARARSRSRDTRRSRASDESYDDETENTTPDFISFSDLPAHLHAPLLVAAVHSADESAALDWIMDKIKHSKLAYWADKLAVENEPGLTNAQLMLTNNDLKPVEPERRKWRAWNFVNFWIADSFNINTWMIASSMISPGGLSWWQAWICVWVGYSFAAMFICLTGRIGATYHIGFPVVSRASFGTWGALWPVLNRAAMACIWYGVQSWIGGECVTLMITAIWPSYANVPNGIPGSGTTTKDFTSFFLFWLLSLPAIWFPVHQIRHLFTVKAVVVPIAGIAFFIWAIVRAHGIGPIVHQPNTVHGSTLAWAVVNGIMSSIANFATLIVNDPDFARFARKPKDALWSQLLTIPLGFAITSFIGIIVSSSSVVIFGDPIWNPLDLLTLFLGEGTSQNRAGVFFISLAFALAQLGTNIAANSVSAGSDMTALLPRYINIRRGGYICATIGLVMCPWNLLSSSNNFTTYLSAYSVFLSSIAGVMVADYYCVRKGFLRIRELYSARRSSPYYYTWGLHWRAYAAYFAGIMINIVGFAGAVGATVPQGAMYVYNLNFFGGFLVSAIIYWILCTLSPVPETSDVWMEVGDDIIDPRLAYNADADESLDDAVSASEPVIVDDKKV